MGVSPIVSLLFSSVTEFPLGTIRMVCSLDSRTSSKALKCMPLVTSEIVTDTRGVTGQQRTEESHGAHFRESLSRGVQSSAPRPRVASLAENLGPCGQSWSNSSQLLDAMIVNLISAGGHGFCTSQAKCNYLLQKAYPELLAIKI